MDPASTILTIVKSALTVYKKASELRKTIKDAPKDLERLLARVHDTMMLLQELKGAEENLPSLSPDDITFLGELTIRAEHPLKGVEEFVAMVRKSVEGGGGEGKVRWMKWLMKKGEFEDVSQKLKEFHDVLCSMNSFVNL